jgi:hypothetical protein
MVAAHKGKPSSSDRIEGKIRSMIDFFCDRGHRGERDVEPKTTDTEQAGETEKTADKARRTFFPLNSPKPRSAH